MIDSVVNESELSHIDEEDTLSTLTAGHSESCPGLLEEVLGSRWFDGK